MSLGSDFEHVIDSGMELLDEDRNLATDTFRRDVSGNLLDTDVFGVAGSVPLDQVP